VKSRHMRLFHRRTRTVTEAGVWSVGWDGVMQFIRYNRIMKKLSRSADYLAHSCDNEGVLQACSNVRI